MVKSPEEYFNEQNFTVDLPADGQFTPAERQFMQKYLGVDAGDVSSPAPDQAAAPASTPPPLLEEPAPVEESMESLLRKADETQMVGFYIGDQEFVIPTFAVQEVIRYSEPSRLPRAPSNIAGIINLRGRVTPVLLLRGLLAVQSKSRPVAEGAYIICRRQGLQIGLHVEKVHTMYRVSQSDLEWGVEFNGESDFICGLMKHDGNLLGIVSVDKIVKYILR